MTDNIENLLRKADQSVGPPARAGVNVSVIHSLANSRRLMNIVAPVAAVAVLVVGLGIWVFTIKTTETRHEQERVVALEAQIKQLHERTDTALNLIHEVLEDERREQRLNELEAQLASIPDPAEEVSKQVDKTVFILIYQADRLYMELNQTDSAVENYNRVIELFPENRWAKVARQRLEEIENKKSDETDSKGDLKWKTLKRSWS